MKIITLRKRKKGGPAENTQRLKLLIITKCIKVIRDVLILDIHQDVVVLQEMLMFL